MEELVADKNCGEELLEEIITDLHKTNVQTRVTSFILELTEYKATISETYEMMDQLENVALNPSFETPEKYYVFSLQLDKYSRNKKILKLTDEITIGGHANMVLSEVTRIVNAKKTEIINVSVPDKDFVLVAAICQTHRLLS